MPGDAEDELDPITLEVYDLFRRMPGDLFTVDAIVSQLGYDADEIEAGLAELLEQDLIIEKGVTEPTYILSERAPEL